MGNRIVITKETIYKKTFLVTALMEDGRMAEVSCDAPCETALLGSIFAAKIRRIVKNAGAAFVELAPGQTAYLPLEDVREPLMLRQSRAGQLTEEDEIVVQVVKEAVKTKEPTVSSSISLTGQGLVFTLENKLLGISKKLNKKEREALKELFAGKKEDWYGLIVRTNAANVPRERLLKEFETLYARFSAIARQYKSRTCYSCLYRAPYGYIANVRDRLGIPLEKIITDDAEVYGELRREFLACASLNEEQIVLYEDNVISLSALYGLKGKLEGALRERVWLKSGGYLVIEPTEALTVIDVNSGKNIKGKRQGLYLSVNLEAAEEIAKQLRLRNISGICVVDFINMDSGKEREELHSFPTRRSSDLKAHLAKDPVPADFVDFTELGLVEITRKKIKKPLWEQVGRPKGMGAL